MSSRFTLGSQQMFKVVHMDAGLKSLPALVCGLVNNGLTEVLTIPQSDTVSTHRRHVHAFDTPGPEQPKFCNLLGLSRVC